MVRSRREFVERCAVDGLSTQEELFAIRLLELARHLSPRGNRVKFVEWCEESRIRSFLERSPNVWERITDNPPREGITPTKDFVSRRGAYALQAAAFQELVTSQLQAARIRSVWLGGLSLSHLLYDDIAEREFEGLKVMVSPLDLESAEQILKELGFSSVDEALRSGQERARIRWGYCGEWTHQSGLTLTLYWRLFSRWIGSDWLPFEEIWERSTVLHWEGLSSWRTLGPADSLLYLSLRAFESGWGRLQYSLDLAVALERLDFTWDEVVQLAGPRSVLLERSVELVVRLLGVPHPQKMTFHYSDYEQALEAWSEFAERKGRPQQLLVAPEFWSCDPSQALRRRLGALTAPEMEEIRAWPLPAPLFFLYPMIKGLKLLLRVLRGRRSRPDA